VIVDVPRRSASRRGSGGAGAERAHDVGGLGGGDDALEIDYVAPSPERSNERIAVEFHISALDHYFVTAESDEAAMLDASVVVAGWQRTGFDFKVHPAGAAACLPTCRFFGTPGIGPNSHFYTIDPAECGKVKGNPFWTYESVAFNSDAPSVNDCAADRIPVARLYNSGQGGQASHRFVASHSEIRELTQRGWIVEGNVFCATP
jgi:serine protease